MSSSDGKTQHDPLAQLRATIKDAGAASAIEALCKEPELRPSEQIGRSVWQVRDMQAGVVAREMITAVVERDEDRSRSAAERDDGGRPQAVLRDPGQTARRFVNAFDVLGWQYEDDELGRVTLERDEVLARVLRLLSLSLASDGEVRERLRSEWMTALDRARSLADDDPKVLGPVLTPLIAPDVSQDQAADAIREALEPLHESEAEVPDFERWVGRFLTASRRQLRERLLVPL